MSTLLSIQSSLFNDQGASATLSKRFIDGWQRSNPGTEIIVRDLIAEPVPHLSLERFQSFTTALADRSEQQREVVAYSDALIDELQRADTIVVGAPMYNFTVPSVLHSYFDHIARSGVTFRYTANGPEGLLTGKRAYVFLSRGGVYGEDHHQTAFLRQILGFVGITNVEFVYAEGLAMGDEARDAALEHAHRRIAELLAALPERDLRSAA